MLDAGGKLLYYLLED